MEVGNELDYARKGNTLADLLYPFRPINASKNHHSVTSASSALFSKNLCVV